VSRAEMAKQAALGALADRQAGLVKGSGSGRLPPSEWRTDRACRISKTAGIGPSAARAVPLFSRRQTDTAESDR
jgi:hypothetical protein